jgi:hypothetical protein
MSLYYFNLKDYTGIIIDQDGTELADEEQAREHATVVAKELMRHREVKTRTWRLQVCDAARQPCFELLFAELAEMHLPWGAGELRNTFVDVSRKFTSVYDAILELRITLHQIDATMARANKMPYLTTLNGRRIEAPP